MPNMLGCPHLFGCIPCMFGHPPVCLDVPICLDTSICLDVPHLFGCPLYVCMPPCLDTPMFGCPLNMCGHSHMFGYLLYICNTKLNMFCQTEGVSICPHTFGHPHVWMSLILLDATIHLAASKHMGAYGHPLSLTKHAFFVLLMYRGHPNIWEASKHMGVSKDTGASKHTEGI